MLKINLLPPYIFERRKARKAAIIFGVAIVAVTVAMLTWSFKLNGVASNLEVELADMQAKAQEVQSLQSRVSAEQAKIPPLEAKVKYIEDVMAYNAKMPKLYEELAKYTYSRILYRSVSPSGSTLSIQAHARTVGDCGRYLLNMYRATHVFSSVAISGVPGWPSGGTGGGGGGMMASMPGGMPGGMPLKMPGGPGMMPGMPGGMAGGMPPKMPGMGGPGMPPGFGGAPGGSASGTSTGFDFSVTCTLVQPIYPPTYGGTGVAAGMGGMGGMGGMPGMDPSMMKVPGMAPGMDPGMMKGPGSMPAGGKGAPPKSAAGGGGLRGKDADISEE